MRGWACHAWGANIANHEQDLFQVLSNSLKLFRNFFQTQQTWTHLSIMCALSAPDALAELHWNWAEGSSFHALAFAYMECLQARVPVTLLLAELLLLAACGRMAGLSLVANVCVKHLIAAGSTIGWHFPFFNHWRSQGVFLFAWPLVRFDFLAFCCYAILVHWFGLSQQFGRVFVREWTSRLMRSGWCRWTCKRCLMPLLSPQ